MRVLCLMTLVLFVGCSNAASRSVTPTPMAPYQFTRMSFVSNSDQGKVYFLTGSSVTFSWINIMAREQGGGDLAVTGEQRILVGRNFPVEVIGLASGQRYTYDVTLQTNLSINGFIVVVLPMAGGGEGFVPVAQIAGLTDGQYVIHIIQPPQNLIPVPKASQFN
jgi:hypothetical protein